MSSSDPIVTHSDRLIVPRPYPQASLARESSSKAVSPHEGSWGLKSTHLDIGSYLEVPFMHKRFLLLCLLAALAIGWIALQVWPRTYESEAKLVVRIGRESVSLDPTATTSQTLMLQKTQEEEINSALEVLSSRQLAEEAVEKLGAGNVIEGVLPSTGGPPQSWLMTKLDQSKKVASDALYEVLLFAGVKDDISDHELAVRELMGSLDISAPKRSNVITIHAESKTPEMARAIAETITAGFMDKHLKVSITDGSLAFFEVESAQAQEKLDALEAERSSFMQKHQVVSIDANRSLLKEQLAAIDLDLNNFRAQFEQAEAEANDIQIKISEAADEIVAAKQEASDQTWSAMRQRTYDLQLREKELAAKYTPDHRLLVQVREQLRGAQQIMEELQSERVNSSTTPNPAKLRLQEEYQKQQTLLVGLKSALQEKMQQRIQVQEKVDELLNLERQLVEQGREIGLVETSLFTLRSKLEEARVIEQLRSERISNIAVFQPATFVERATSPPKKILIIAMAFLGLASGFGLVFLRDASSRTLRTSEDVQSQLHLPVLASIPMLKRKPNPTAANPVLRRYALQVLSDLLMSRAQADRNEGYVLGVLGVDKDSGSTTQAIQLALSASDDCAMQTILVDADAKHRSLSKSFGLNGHPGLAELASGDATHDDCLQQSNRGDVGLIACSAMNSNRRITVRPLDLIYALDAYRSECDLMIVDLPPASNPDQTNGLAQHLDGVLIVIESEQASSDAAERLVSRLQASGVEVLGAILNKKREYLPAFVKPFVSAKR